MMFLAYQRPNETMVRRSINGLPRNSIHL